MSVKIKTYDLLESTQTFIYHLNVNGKDVRLRVKVTDAVKFHFTRIDENNQLSLTGEEWSEIKRKIMRR